MKKIKSVKLKNDYRTAYCFLAKGALLINDGEGYWTTYRGHRYPDNEIRNCKTDLFEIEYEEGIKFVDIRFEFPAVYEFITTEGLKNATIKDYCLPDLKVTKLGEGTL